MTKDSGGYETIGVERRDGALEITLDRPEVMNAINEPMADEIMDAMAAVELDREILVVILQGNERAFCAGADLGGFKDEIHERYDNYRARYNVRRNRVLYKFMQAYTKPVISAVEGYCLGGGFELALSCDLIIASEDARFGLPEARVGVVASGGGPHRIVRQLPLNIAMGILLGGKPITAKQAHGWGLVNEVAATKTDLMATAERWANDIMEAAPLSVRATKQVALQGLESTLDVAINREYSEFRKARHSEDFVEGPRAFAAKRKPVWKGR